MKNSSEAYKAINLINVLMTLGMCLIYSRLGVFLENRIDVQKWKK